MKGSFDSAALRSGFRQKAPARKGGSLTSSERLKLPAFSFGGGSASSAKYGRDNARTALAMQHGAIPATLHLDDPDPECYLNHVPHQPRQARLTHALALARGFEGQAVALLLARPR